MTRRSLISALLIVAAILTLGFAISFLNTVHAQTTPWPPPPYNPVAISFASSGDNTVLASATTGQCIYAMYFVVGGATNITIKNGSTAQSGAMPMTANGSGFWAFTNNPKNPWFFAAPGSAFIINNSNAVQVSGSVYAAPCP